MLLFTLGLTRNTSSYGLIFFSSLLVVVYYYYYYFLFASFLIKTHTTATVVNRTAEKTTRDEFMRPTVCTLVCIMNGCIGEMITLSFVALKREHAKLEHERRARLLDAAPIHFVCPHV